MSALAINEMATAMRATVRRAAGNVSGFSIDSRTAQRRETFFAIQGDNRGHEFVEALKIARPSRSSRAKLNLPPAQLLESTTSSKARDRARAARSIWQRSWRLVRSANRPRMRAALGANGENMLRSRPTTIIGVCRCRCQLPGRC